jgi:hypothetical protein
MIDRRKFMEPFRDQRDGARHQCQAPLTLLAQAQEVIE